MRPPPYHIRLIGRIASGVIVCAFGIYFVKLTTAYIHELDVPFRDNYVLIYLIAAYFVIGGIVAVAFPRQARGISLLYEGRASGPIPRGTLTFFVAMSALLVVIVFLMILAYTRAS